MEEEPAGLPDRLTDREMENFTVCGCEGVRVCEGVGV